MKINKACFVLPVLIFIVLFNLNAQVSVAPKIGLSYAKLAGAPSNAKVMPGAYFGGIANIKMHTYYSLQTGLLLAGKGTSLKFSDEDEDEILITYLEFPFNSVLTFPAGSGAIQLFGGPYLGMAVNARYRYLEDENNMMEKIPIGINAGDEIKPTDIGVNFGIGFIFEGLEFQFGYGRSITNISNLQNETLKNSVITASLAYFFGYESNN